MNELFRDIVIYWDVPVYTVCSGADWLSHLSYIEQQSYGVVEVGVGAAGVDPEVPEDREQSGAGQQDTGHQEDVPQDYQWSRESPHQGLITGIQYSTDYWTVRLFFFFFLQIW